MRPSVIRSIAMSSGRISTRTQAMGQPASIRHIGHSELDADKRPRVTWKRARRTLELAFPLMVSPLPENVDQPASSNDSQPWARATFSLLLEVSRSAQFDAPKVRCGQSGRDDVARADFGNAWCA